MSVQRWFQETEAVVQVLSEFIERGETEVGDTPITSRIIQTDSEEFTALWQAAELLSRAYSVLLPMVQFEQSKAALNLPDIQTEKPKQKKAARLYDAQGRPLNAE